MTHTVLTLILAASLWYLGAFAEITRPIWRRYPMWLDRFLSCPSCAGAWYAAEVAFVFDYFLNRPFAGLPGAAGWIVAGLVAVSTTPVLGALLVSGLARIGSPGAEHKD